MSEMIWTLQDNDNVYNIIMDGEQVPSNSSKNDGWYCPLWQTSPPMKHLGDLNFDFLQQKSIAPAIHTVTTSRGM